MTVSRREFLERAVVALPMAVMACGPRSITPEIFTRADQGRLTPYPEIQRDHLDHLLEALYSSGVPLYRQLGEHLKTATSSSARPKDIPNWVTPDSFPLKVVVSQETLSTLQLISSTKGEESEFLVEHTNGPTIKYYEIDYLRIQRITLGLPPHLKVEGYLPQALYLAKEYLSFIVKLRMALDAYDAVPPSMVTIKDKLGQPVTDREKQVAYGAAFALIQAQERSTYFWKGPDSLSIFMLADGIIPAVRGGKLPQQSTTMKYFYIARNIMTDKKELDTLLADYNKQWVAKGTVLPPQGLGQKVFAEPLFSAIGLLHKTMYQGQ